MTKSEQICNDIAVKFFCKEYVYENLKYFNENNEKVELCDGLFEYAGVYIPLQIKERGTSKKDVEKWLKDRVYNEAVEQIKKTVEGIRLNSIIVNDCYHQPVSLNKNNFIYPVIVFDNSDVKNYKRVIKVDEIEINVLSLKDYDIMMKTLVHPYDIIYYLQERTKWVQNNLPTFVMGDTETTSIMSRIENEEDFAKFFLLFIYDGDESKRNSSMTLLKIIQDFRAKRKTKGPEYKKILNILQLIEPLKADAFMERFIFAWKAACSNEFNYSKNIQIEIDGKKISIVFFSIGNKPLEDNRYCEILLDAKQLKQKANSILLIMFRSDNGRDCFIDWGYYEKEYLPNDEWLDFYESIGMFDNSIMDRATFVQVCDKLLQKTT